MKNHSQSCLYFCHCKVLSYAVPAKSNHGQKLIRKHCEIKEKKMPTFWRDVSAYERLNQCNFRVSVR